MHDEGDNYELHLARGAARAISEFVPENVAAAVVEFITGALVVDPRTVGKPLRNELSGLWSARRGTYRIIYSIDESARSIVVVRIQHRSDAYRA